MGKSSLLCLQTFSPLAIVFFQTVDFFYTTACDIIHSKEKHVQKLEQLVNQVRFISDICSVLSKTHLLYK